MGVVVKIKEIPEYFRNGSGMVPECIPALREVQACQDMLGGIPL